MKPSLLPLIICPHCSGKMRLQVFNEDNEIEEGLFSCHCGRFFPIIRAVPILMDRDLERDFPAFYEKYRDQLPDRLSIDENRLNKNEHQVRDSYSEQWSSLPGVGLDRLENQSKQWDWFRRKMGFKDWEAFHRYFSGKKMILDAGTGRGPKVMKICHCNQEGTVIGVDFSESVFQAYQCVREFPNAHVIQADIRGLPFRKQLFDVIVCDGVLHHTSDTRKSLEKLSEWVRPGGDMAIHVYKKMNQIRNFTDDLIRAQALKLTVEECWEFCKAFTSLGKALHESASSFDIPMDIPLLGLQKGYYDLQRFFHYHIALCFWDESLSFDENNWINFDYFHPAYAHRHREEEVLAWFKELGFHSLQSVPASRFGISVLATAPLS